MKSENIIEKTIKVIASCKTEAQIKCARRYFIFAWNKYKFDDLDVSYILKKVEDINNAPVVERHTR